MNEEFKLTKTNVMISSIRQELSKERNEPTLSEIILKLESEIEAIYFRGTLIGFNKFSLGIGFRLLGLSCSTMLVHPHPYSDYKKMFNNYLMKQVQPLWLIILCYWFFGMLLETLTFSYFLHLRHNQISDNVKLMIISTPLFLKNQK